VRGAAAPASGWLWFFSAENISTRLTRFSAVFVRVQPRSLGSFQLLGPAITPACSLTVTAAPGAVVLPGTFKGLEKRRAV
jgi:hypothetical protein